MPRAPANNAAVWMGGERLAFELSIDFHALVLVTFSAWILFGKQLSTVFVCAVLHGHP